MSDESVRQGPLSATPPSQGGTAGEESLGDLAGSTENVVRSVPRYRLLGPIGIGGMGVVYRAEDTRLGRTVALKFLPPTLTPNPREKVRFLNEARAASALDHPNICTIYEVGETAEGQLYLAMAYYEGETLKRRLERGPLPVAEALNLALQVARGLAKAHRRGIVHRDIKPANLMVTVDGIVKILDFGIARLPDQTLSGPLLGTPGYMSPEQCRGGTVDARSDVWSLGVVLREMLTGWRPGRDGHPAALPEGTPPGLDGVLSRMLAEEPADRYADAAALLADLSAMERTAAGPAGALASPPTRRRIPAGAVAALIAAALVVAAGAWRFRGIRGQEKTGPGAQQPAAAAPAELAGKKQFDHLTDLQGKEWFPSISPEGNLVVYARKVDGRSRLFLQPVGDSGALYLLSDSSADDSQPAFSPDGQQIAFRSERDGGGIFLTGPMGKSVRRLTNIGFNPSWSPDGKEILYATEKVENPLIRRHLRSQIYRLDLATLKASLIPTGDAVQPTWSPRRWRIAYWGIGQPGKRMIWTIPAGGGKAVPVTQGEYIDWNPVWSPDGRYLYFGSNRSGVTNLWRVPIDERTGQVQGDPEPVTTSGPAGMLLSLSRDGKRIVYTSDDSRTFLEKVAFDPASGTIARPILPITQTSNMIPGFDASRDGRWLVYQTFMPQEDLFVIKPDGKGLRRLTQDGYKDRLPRWSPDNERIAFYSNRGGNYEIWTIRADGSQRERVASVPGRQMQHPVWSPDGQQLACDLYENEALVDLRPAADRRPQFLPSPGGGMGFSASSWSADGRWLAGALHEKGGLEVPGVVLYSLDDREYVRLTEQGESPTWLSDSRRLLYKDGGTLSLLDVRSRVPKAVLPAPPDSDFTDFCFSANDRVLYLARNDEQSDIWLLTIK